MRYFDTRFLEEADKFISKLDSKRIKKLFYNIAFWDKSDKKNTLVIATHGFIKKVDKVPANEINRAVRIMDKYFDNKT